MAPTDEDSRLENERHPRPSYFHPGDFFYDILRSISDDLQAFCPKGACHGQHPTESLWVAQRAAARILHQGENGILSNLKSYERYASTAALLYCLRGIVDEEEILQTWKIESLRLPWTKYAAEEDHSGPKNIQSEVLDSWRNKVDNAQYEREIRKAPDPYSLFRATDRYTKLKEEYALFLTQSFNNNCGKGTCPFKHKADYIVDAAMVFIMDCQKRYFRDQAPTHAREVEHWICATDAVKKYLKNCPTYEKDLYYPLELLWFHPEWEAAADRRVVEPPLPHAPGSHGAAPKMNAPDNALKVEMGRAKESGNAIRMFKLFEVRPPDSVTKHSYTFPRKDKKPIEYSSERCMDCYRRARTDTGICKCGKKPRTK